MRKLTAPLKWAAGLLLLALVAFVSVRAYKSLQGPQLEPWHIFAPEELSLDEIDQGNWKNYIDAEDRIFESVRENVTRKLADEERVPFNRYFEGSPVNPDHFERNWNRSYQLEPEKKAAGAVVLLHGLTDSPYSLRHIASFYRDRGFAVVAIRIPGHGATPAGLAVSDWKLWLAATRLAVREARRLAPDPAPLQIVGFSNGGSLALKYALDAIEDPHLPQANRLVLISPMVGVTAFARFAGLAGLPAVFPAFAKAAWLSILPEFNPFKYNSFPVNGARQSWRLTDALQRQIGRLQSDGRLATLPPVLTFQSVLDFTVSTRAILSELYEQLPANGSELVLFDINRNTKFGPLFRTSSDVKISDLAPPRARRFRLTIVENAGEGTDDARERVIEAGDTEGRSRALGLKYPKGVYSLSHVALPFPLNDSLYGLEPDGPEEFGVHLGAIPLRGERGALIVNLEALVRMSSNPFFPFLLSRIDSVATFKVNSEASRETAPPVGDRVREAQPRGADTVRPAALNKQVGPTSRPVSRKGR
jgi:alpha-beta hydrolase superfamily lysophospholipase